MILVGNFVDLFDFCLNYKFCENIPEIQGNDNIWTHLILSVQKIRVSYNKCLAVIRTFFVGGTFLHRCSLRRANCAVDISWTVIFYVPQHRHEGESKLGPFFLRHAPIF